MALLIFRVDLTEEILVLRSLRLGIILSFQGAQA